MKLTKGTKVIGCLMIAVALYSAVINSTSNNYGSYYEAKEAYEEWKEAGGTKEVKIFDPVYRGTRTYSVRRCWYEKETTQVLGRVEDTVIERFRY